MGGWVDGCMNRIVDLSFSFHPPTKSSTSFESQRSRLPSYHPPTHPPTHPLLLPNELILRESPSTRFLVPLHAGHGGALLIEETDLGVSVWVGGWVRGEEEGLGEPLEHPATSSPFFPSSSSSSLDELARGDTSERRQLRRGLNPFPFPPPPSSSSLLAFAAPPA